MQSFRSKFITLLAILTAFNAHGMNAPTTISQALLKILENKEAIIESTKAAYAAAGASAAAAYLYFKNEKQHVKKPNLLADRGSPLDPFDPQDPDKDNDSKRVPGKKDDPVIIYPEIVEPGTFSKLPKIPNDPDTNLSQSTKDVIKTVAGLRGAYRFINGFYRWFGNNNQPKNDTSIIKNENVRDIVKNQKPAADYYDDPVAKEKCEAIVKAIKNKVTRTPLDGVFSSVEDAKNIDKMLLFQYKGKTYTADNLHLVAGDIYRRRLGGAHYSPSLDFFDRIITHDLHPNPIQPKMIELTWSPLGKEFSSLQVQDKGKFSTIFVGTSEEFANIANQGWQEAINNGELARQHNRWNELSSNSPEKYKAVTFIGKTQSGHHIEYVVDFNKQRVKTCYLVSEKNLKKYYEAKGLSEAANKQRGNINNKNDNAGKFSLNQETKGNSNKLNEVEKFKSKPQKAIQDLNKGLDKELTNVSPVKEFKNYKVKLDVITTTGIAELFQQIPPYEGNNPTHTTPAKLQILKKDKKIKDNKSQQVVKDDNNCTSANAQDYFANSRGYASTFAIDKLMQAKKRPTFDHEIGISYRRETIDLREAYNTPEAKFMRDNRHFRYLIETDPEFVREYEAWKDLLINIAANTNCTTGTGCNFGHPIVAKFMLLHIETDKFVVGKAFNELRSQLLPIYFDKKTGAIKEIRTANEEMRATKAIIDFIYDMAPTKEVYIRDLERLKALNVYHIKDVLHKNRDLQPDSFLMYGKRPPAIQIVENKTLFNTIMSNEETVKCSNIIRSFLSQDFRQARLTIEEIKCKNFIKEDLKFAHRALFFQSHNSKGVYKAFEQDPLLAKLTPEAYKEIVKSFDNAEKFNVILFNRHIFAHHWARFLNIDNWHDNKVLKNHLYEFAALSQRPEDAIDSLMTLSSDARSNEEKDAYKAFFNDKGILKIFDKVPAEFSDIPEIISTSKATELRRYLNYTLRYINNQEHQKNVSDILTYVKDACNQITEDNNKFERDLSLIRGIYNAISIDLADKTILSCDLTLTNYSDIEKNKLQDNFVNAISKSIAFLNKTGNKEIYNKKARIINEIMLYANHGKSALSQGNIEDARTISSILSKVFYKINETDKETLNVKLIEDLSNLLKEIKTIINNNKIG